MLKCLLLVIPLLESLLIIAGLHLLQEDEAFLKSPKLFLLLDLQNPLRGDVSITERLLGHGLVVEIWSSAGHMCSSELINWVRDS